jgi:hypothetical protein
LKNRIEVRFELPFADVLNLFIFVLTIVALVISFFSLWVAINTKRSADESGEAQDKILSTSSRSLQSSQLALENVISTLNKTNSTLGKSVDIATEQQKQLQLQVQASRGQLDIASREWQRESSQPDIGARLTNIITPSIQVFNFSAEKPVIDGQYQLLLGNLDHPIASGYQAVSNPTASVDWIRPLGSYLPSILNFVVMPEGTVRQGDHLFGYLSVDCRDCKTHRVYGVYMEFQKKGYFKELSPSEYSIVRSSNTSAVEKMNAFLALPGLIAIE